MLRAPRPRSQAHGHGVPGHQAAGRFAGLMGSADVVAAGLALGRGLALVGRPAPDERAPRRAEGAMAAGSGGPPASSSPTPTTAGSGIDAPHLRHSAVPSVFRATTPASTS